MPEVSKEMAPAMQMRIGYAYVPPQVFDNLYSPEEALQNGTLFRELNIPMEAYGPMGV